MKIVVEVSVIFNELLRLWCFAYFLILVGGGGLAGSLLLFLWV